MQTENNDKVASPTAAKAESGDENKSGALTVTQLAQFLQQEAKPKAEEHTDTQEEQSSESDEGTAPETVETEEVQAEPEAEAETDVLSQLNLENLDPKTKELVERELEAQKKSIHEKVEKRIGKEVAKTKEAKEKLAQYEQELAALNQQLEQLKSTPQQPIIDPVGKMPLENINDLVGLQAKHDEAKTALRWAEAALEDGIPDEGLAVQVGDKSEVLLREDILRIKRNAKRVLEDEVPARYKFLQEFAQASKQAVEIFPWYKNKDSEEYKLAQAQLASAPWANKLHNRDVLVGFLVEGIAAVNKRQSAQATKTPQKKAPLEQATATAAPKTTPRVDSETLKKSQGTKVFTDLAKKGNVGQRQLAQALLKSL